MTYLEQVKAALWGLPVEEQPLDEQLLDRHMRQGTAPLVFPLLPMTPPMKVVCVSTIQQQVKIMHTLRLAWDALTRAGIQPVLMKGAGLAALYPSPEQRSYGDIDLYVGQTQYHPACAVMRETFPKALKFDEELDHYKHYNLIADGISIEIHRVTVDLQHPCDHRRYARMEAYGMAHAIPVPCNPSPVTPHPSPLTLTIPEPTFNALLIMLHSWEHMMTRGANLRQLCDLTLLLHHYATQIDAKRLKRYLTSLHLLDVWQLYMFILVQHLGLPQNEALFYTNDAHLALRAEHLLNDLLEGRLIEPEHTQNPPKGRFARKFHTMRQRMVNARRIGQYSPAYGRHLVATTLLHGTSRLFAKDRKWE